MKSTRTDLLWILGLLGLLVLAWKFPGPQFGRGWEHERGQPVRFRLVSATTNAVPGQVLELGLEFLITPGWHLYWQGRSDSGGPIEVAIDLPPGFTLGELQWPAPQRHISPGDILDHIYEERPMLIQSVHVPPTAESGQVVDIRCRADWVVCREACEFGGATDSLQITIAAPGQQPSPSGDAELFTLTRRRLPVPLSAGGNPRVQWRDDTLVVTMEQAAYLAFYPAKDCGQLMRPLTDAESRDGRLALRFRRENGIAGPARGVLEVRKKTAKTPEFFALDLASPAATSGDDGAGSGL